MATKTKTKARPKKAKKLGSVSFTVPRLEDQKNVSKSRQGVHTKLGITQFVTNVLAANETVPKARRLTDEMIKKLIISEFPNATGSKNLKNGKWTVGYWRGLYNLGHFNYPDHKPPKVKSWRYDVDGDRADQRTGRKLATK